VHIRTEVWNRNIWMAYDRCKPMSLVQCTSLSEVESPMYMYVSQYMYDMSYCTNAIITIWCMIWTTKAWFVLVNLWKYIFLKTLWLTLFVYGVCFVFKFAMIMHITREQRIWQFVWHLSEQLRSLILFYFVIVQRYFY